MTSSMNSTGRKGKTWTANFAILAFFLLVMVKPSEEMAEPSVVCTNTLFNYSGDDGLEMAVKELKNCTVLEGGLHILRLKLPDVKSPTAYAKMLDKYSLPKLREISGFLLLYKSKGLHSLSDLFPNLTVIRGENALDGHISFLITQNEDLKRIGLNLAILNGSVHIRNNAKLCVEQDIHEWKKYSASVSVDIKKNMPDIIYSGTKISLCRIYNETVPAWPTPPSTSCHEECLGGCTGPSPSDCYVCRSFQHNDTCIKECPCDKWISLPSHRCVDEEECRSRELPKIFAHLYKLEKHAMFMVQNNATCLPDCPKPYKPFYENGLLKCRKVTVGQCRGKRITSLEDLEVFQGCTLATNSLEIRIERCQKCNFSEYEVALERSLGKIKEITGALHIRRLHGVRNLHFLRSLRTINHTENEKFSVLIDENASLTELFHPEVTKNLNVVGNPEYIVISNNPLLCSREILKLQERIRNVTRLLEFNISDSYNGVRAQCNDSALPVQTTIMNVTATSAFVKWDTPEILPTRYSTVYFRPAPGNITYSRLSLNVPSLEYWESVDNLGNYSDNRPFILNSLMSGTRYAFYIEVVGETHAVQVSKVQYFWTEKQNKPPKDKPCSVTAWPYPTLLSSESSLKIEWAMPQRTAFNDRFLYLVTGEYLKDTASPCSSQKFHRFRISDYDTVLKQCKSEESPIATRRQIIETCNNFSDTLDAVLRSTEHRMPAERFPNQDNFTMASSPPAQTLAKIITENRTDTLTGRLEYFAVVANTEAVVVNNLFPFGQYVIKVYFCIAQQYNTSFDNGSKSNITNLTWESKCGLPGFGSGRSSAIENADKFILPPTAAPSNYSTSFVLQWEKARASNSLVWYTIEVSGINENFEKQGHCTDKDEYRFDDMPPGIYAICVTMESLAKTGETKCITYSAVEGHIWRNFFLVFFGIGFAIIALGFAVRKIQRTQSEDRIVLLSEDSFDTHVRLSDLPGNDMETIPI